MSIKCAGRPDIQCVSLADVTDRVCEALDDVGESVHRLQHLIAPLVLEAACTQSRAFTRITRLRSYQPETQKPGRFPWRAGAHFTGRLAGRSTIATKVLTLADLSTHLSFAKKDEDAPHEPGDFEMFS